MVGFNFIKFFMINNTLLNFLRIFKAHFLILTIQTSFQHFLNKNLNKTPLFSMGHSQLISFVRPQPSRPISAPSPPLSLGLQASVHPA